MNIEERELRKLLHLWQMLGDTLRHILPEDAKKIEGEMRNFPRISLGEIGLGNRALNCLTAHGFTFLEEVAQLTAEDLRKFRSLGPVTLDEIREKLKKFGLKLKHDP